MANIIKREPGYNIRSRRTNTEESAQVEDPNYDSFTRRRVLRSRYLNVKNRISDERDNISSLDSNKFNLIFDEVETLHQQVQKPREQITDAEALLDITSTLVTSVKAHSNAGVTPSDFVAFLLRDFGQEGGASTSSDEGRNTIRWMNIGIAVSDIFERASGCCTMLGPMNSGIKQRKAAIRRKHVRPTESAHPEDLNESATEERTDTDKNMATMFNILRQYRRARLENLILNRNSFAQTVENLFALSFLVKDGRAEIMAHDKGTHLVSPRNAPPANAVASGEVSYSHFVFRFDFSDWKLMMTAVQAGGELMPNRDDISEGNSQLDFSPRETQTLPTTPIRKLTRNRGRVLQEQTVVEDSTERDDAIRKGKRKLG